MAAYDYLDCTGNTAGAAPTYYATATINTVAEWSEWSYGMWLQSDSKDSDNQIPASFRQASAAMPYAYLNNETHAYFGGEDGGSVACDYGALAFIGAIGYQGDPYWSGASYCQTAGGQDFARGAEWISIAAIVGPDLTLCGNIYGADSAAFDGKMFEFKLWHSVKTEANFDTLYSAGAP